ncbi:hypothetical protein TAMA11512_12330 [Selenomonas sp. TAMA-11512]|uniref:HlyD family secretion protein n=1 Tax=Selenomonas sp. TAMA-11512 TaxID=3095337 RepID=UPI00308969A5|nr:hypothetical protein TAMA11512_12330 [Selenomonas sp. TAMA-11512]
MEVDVTTRVSRYLRMGFFSLVLFIFVLGASLYLYQQRTRGIELSDAVIQGDMVEVKTKTKGILAGISVNDGDVVEAAAPILVLTVPLGEAELKQLEDTVALTKRNLTDLQKGITVMREVPVVTSSAGSGASVAAAQERLDRMNKLYEMGAISAVKRDQAQAEYQAALASSSTTAASSRYQTSVQPASPEVVKQGETALKQAEVAFANAKKTIEESVVKAPVPGIVHLLPWTVGQELEEDTTIAWIESQTSFHIEATAPITQKSQFAVGQPVQYDLAGHSMQGMVQEITEDDASLHLRISLPTDTEDYAAGDKISVRVLR